MAIYRRVEALARGSEALASTGTASMEFLHNIYVFKDKGENLMCNV